MWGEEKEQKLCSGLEGNAIVCVLKAEREPKEAGKTVWAVFPPTSRPEAGPGSAPCPSGNPDPLMVWFELPQVWCVPAIACALLLPGVLCWSSGWRRRAQRFLVLMQGGQQRFSVADLPF